jgi:hypothetical protein
MSIKLLDEATATNGVPTTAVKTAGFALTGVGTADGGRFNVPPLGGVSSISVRSTAGSGTMACTLRIWLWSDLLSDWAPYGADATAANRGLINATNSIDEVIANRILHTELVTGLSNYEAIYLQITAITGTATAISAWLHGR